MQLNEYFWKISFSIFTYTFLSHKLFLYNKLCKTVFSFSNCMLLLSTFQGMFTMLPKVRKKCSSVSRGLEVDRRGSRQKPAQEGWRTQVKRKRRLLKWRSAMGRGIYLFYLLFFFLAEINLQIKKVHLC